MALARTNDPSTSHDAARAIEQSGVAAVHRARCLQAVRHQPGQTAAEIARNVSLERHASSRRLPELRDAGLVVNGPIRICAVKGRRSLTWFPAPKGML